MLHKIKDLFIHLFFWLEEPAVKDAISDVKIAGGTSFTLSVIIKALVPELAHGLSLLFWGGTCTIAFYFLRRWLKKNFPEHEYKAPKEPDTEDKP